MSKGLRRGDFLNLEKNKISVVNPFLKYTLFFSKVNAKTDLKLVEEDIVNKKKYDYQSKTKQEEGN